MGYAFETVDVFTNAQFGGNPLFTMALLTALLNPKIAVLYLTLLPQFIDPARGSILLQGFMLGVLQITVSLSANAVIVLVSGSLARRLATRPA